MMNDSEITVFIENPGLLKNASLDQFSNLVKQYPYFQTAHILFLKALKDSGSEAFQSQLERSSIYISDRDLLFRFLNQEFKTIEKKEEENDTRVKKEEQQNTQDDHILKNKNIRRKINDSIEGMGANISETITSQIEFSNVKKEKLEYPTEIYFIEEEREGKNNIVTIDAEPGKINKIKKSQERFQIEEPDVKNDKIVIEEETESKEPFELIESEEIEKENKDTNKSGFFDISEYNEENENEDLKDDLISRFIKDNPRIETKEIDEEIEDISQESVKEDSNLLSETLIRVYIKQGLFEKAIESYKKLSLNYPEKSSYFASQIKILEEKINKQ